MLLASSAPLVVISGPCVIEGERFALETAEALKEMFARTGVQLIYKSSYDKANRSSVDSFRGPGLKGGLRILEKVKEIHALPLLTDIHHPEEAKSAARVCDILQIPAFLCRQTDLLLAAGETGAIVNLKKGQFMAPWDMEHAVKKILETGNDKNFLNRAGHLFRLQPSRLRYARDSHHAKIWFFPSVMTPLIRSCFPEEWGNIPMGNGNSFPPLQKPHLQQVPIFSISSPTPIPHWPKATNIL